MKMEQIPSNTPVPMMEPKPGPAAWLAVWIKALTKPSEITYSEIANSSEARANTAYLWVFIASLFSSFFSIIIQGITLRGRGGFDGQGMGMILATVICGTPILAAITTLCFALGTAIIQWIAKLFGGQGRYDQLAYVFAAITTPFSLISSIFILFSAIPYVGLCFNVILFIACLYVLVLEIMAVKAVNGFGWGPAIASVLIPGLVIVFVCGCVVIGGLTLLAPTIGNVFSGINQSLAP
jgi:hypothetical protein